MGRKGKQSKHQPVKHSSNPSGLGNAKARQLFASALAVVGVVGAAAWQINAHPEWFRTDLSDEDDIVRPIGAAANNPDGSTVIELDNLVIDVETRDDSLTLKQRRREVSLGKNPVDARGDTRTSGTPQLFTPLLPNQGASRPAEGSGNGTSVGLSERLAQRGSFQNFRRVISDPRGEASSSRQPLTSSTVSTTNQASPLNEAVNRVFQASPSVSTAPEPSAPIAPAGAPSPGGIPSASRGTFQSGAAGVSTAQPSSAVQSPAKPTNPNSITPSAANAPAPGQFAPTNSGAAVRTPADFSRGSFSRSAFDDR
ncbi:MAG: hypothetical protein AAGG02_04625 [Cyanobacteria bacterium P01_H01_bin.15]